MAPGILENNYRIPPIDLHGQIKRWNVAIDSIKRMNRERINKRLLRNTSTAIAEQKTSNLSTIELLPILKKSVKSIYHCLNGYVLCLMRMQSHFYLLALYHYHEHNDLSGSFFQLIRESLRSLKPSSIGFIFKRLCIPDQENIENNMYSRPLDRRLVEFEPKPKICRVWYFLSHHFLKNPLLLHSDSSAQRHYIGQIKYRYYTKRADTLKIRVSNDITFSFDTSRLVNVLVNAEFSRLSLRYLSPTIFENVMDLSDCKDKYCFIDTLAALNNTYFSYNINGKNDIICSALIRNRTISEEENLEQQKIVSDSEAQVTKRLGLLCTKIQNIHESVVSEEDNHEQLEIGSVSEAQVTKQSGLLCTKIQNIHESVVSEEDNHEQLEIGSVSEAQVTKQSGLLCTKIQNNHESVVSEEDNHEQQELVSDSQVHATERPRLLCTKLENNRESLEPSVHNLNEQQREFTKSVSLKTYTIDLKLDHERTKTKFQSEKIEDFDIPFTGKVNDDIHKEKSVLHRYTRFLCFEHTEPIVAIVNPAFRKEKNSKDTKDSSCCDQNRSSEQEPDLRETSLPADNNESNNYTIAAATLPLGASHNQDEVGIDGHARVSDGLSKQTHEVIPKVTDADDFDTTSDSSETESSVHDTARDIAVPNPDIDNATIQGFEPLMNIIDKIAEGQSVPPQVSMRYEMLRFCTLRSYPTENKPYTIRLAQAGFYYARNSDEVVCYCCASRKSNWTENDRPLDIHRELNPNCSFLVRNSEVNVPIRGSLFVPDGSSAQSHRSNSQQSFQNQHHNGNSPSAREAVPQSENDDRTSEHSRGLPQGTPCIATTEHLAISSGYRAKEHVSHGNFVQVDMPRPTRQEVQQQFSGVSTAAEFFNGNPVGSSQSTGAVTHVLPKYPKYASNTVRLTSFNECGDIVVRPESLAEAGFFYAGFGDCVRCFQCGVGLRHWSEEDDPWIEHSRWSKDCSFVRQVRGQEFVRLVQMAVQYSQGQNGNQHSQNEFAASTNLGTNGNEIDKLLHTNAAQSVLEMGYEPNIIRKAIRLILDNNGKAVLTASNLMEKIFEIEESEDRDTPLGSDLTNLASQTSGASSGTADGGNLREKGSYANTSNPLSTGAGKGASFTGSASGAITASLSGGISRQENSSSIKRSLGLEQKRLKEENEKLKMQSICTKCKKRDVSIVFLPCGHLVTCEECAPTVKYCTVASCGKYIKGTVRTYVS